MAGKKSIVVGIDAGGTSVRIAAADGVTGAIIAEANGDAAEDGGPEPAIELLRGMNLVGVTAICAGIAKLTRAGIPERWQSALRPVFPQRVAEASVLLLSPDYAVAFRGAMPETAEAGIAIIAGTGSVAYGETAAGVSVRVGGRGWEYGDEGSGSHLTTEIIRRTLRTLDGREPLTPLNEAVCTLLGTKDPNQLGGAARERSETEGRGFLVPLLLYHAQFGDKEAANLFIGAAGWLSSLVWRTHRQLGFAPEDAIPVATVGGLWEAGDLILPPFRELIARRMPGASVIPPDASPVIGAVRMARKMIKSNVG